VETVSLIEAKTNLSKLVDKAAAGDSFIISKYGKPLVIVASVADSYRQKTKRVGFLKEELKDFEMPEDFNAILAGEIADCFEGS
jgi:prevent-host-death family protein